MRPIGHGNLNRSLVQILFGLTELWLRNVQLTLISMNGGVQHTNADEGHCDKHPDCPMGLTGQLKKNGSKKLITMFCQGGSRWKKIATSIMWQEEKLGEPNV